MTIKFSKKSNIEPKTVGGIIIFIFIMLVLIDANVFSTIIEAFSVPELKGFGGIIGALFIIMIIFELFKRALGR
ncbi:MAG: hypothetical protein ACOCQ4_00355 [bacterium]